MESCPEVRYRNIVSLQNMEGKLRGKLFEQMKLSVRSYHRILKVSRTIADMEESEEIHAVHIAEALTYRVFNNKYKS